MIKNCPHIKKKSETIRLKAKKGSKRAMVAN